LRPGTFGAAPPKEPLQAVDAKRQSLGPAGTFKRELSFIRCRIISIVHDRISFRHDLRREDLQIREQTLTRHISATR
jgi:hypothetical protein